MDMQALVEDMKRVAKALRACEETAKTSAEFFGDRAKQIEAWIVDANEILADRPRAQEIADALEEFRRVTEI
jgi:hypothetical protein